MKAIIDKIEHLLCVASDAGKAEAGGDTATAERLDMELKRGVEVIEQALGPAETTSEICDRMWWPAIGGEHGRFRTFKENPADKHSPWHLVMPGGDSVPLNHCADDAVDEARCRWMVDALNRALGVVVPATAQRWKCSNKDHGAVFTDYHGGRCPDCTEKGMHWSLYPTPAEEKKDG